MGHGQMEQPFKPLMAHVLGNILWIELCVLTVLASHIASTSSFVCITMWGCLALFLGPSIVATYARPC